jgi:hypothetical protein
MDQANQPHILYKKRKKYRYNLHEDISFETDLPVPQGTDLHYLAIDDRGLLTLRRGYAWDGPSGPTIHTANFMRGSLIHDALYQLIREGVLPSIARKRADEILRDECRRDGMSRFRSGYVFWAVRFFASGAAAPDLLRAPS